MSSLVLVKPDGSTKELDATELREFRTVRKNLRHEQPPGMNMSFMVGRSDDVITDLRATCFVQAASETAARTAIQAIYDFARDAVSVHRAGVTDALEAETHRELMGNGGSVIEARSGPLHHGATDWTVLLRLVPRFSAYEFTYQLLQSPAGEQLVSPGGQNLVTRT